MSSRQKLHTGAHSVPGGAILADGFGYNGEVDYPRLPAFGPTEDHAVKLESLRKEYERFQLSEGEVDANPINQFGFWFEQAIQSDLPEPHAMTLATATPDGRPSARIVLLRGYDDRGFGFFTNYESRKGEELAANPWGALVFYWHDLERQVRIEGRVEKVDAEESEQYFHTRPTASRIGALASPQSRVIASRDVLESIFREYEQRHSDGVVPRPAHWGGFRVIPDSIEFWQGRPSRLHDRLRYTRLPDGGWKLERLAP